LTTTKTKLQEAKDQITTSTKAVEKWTSASEAEGTQMANEGGLVDALNGQLDKIIQKTKKISTEQKTKDRALHAKCEGKLKPDEEAAGDV